MKIRTTFTFPIACGALLLAAGVFFAQSGAQEEGRDLAPHGKGIGTMYEPGRPGTHFGPTAHPGAGPTGAAVSQQGINYHNGPIMTAPTNVYLIWYGNWAGTKSNANSQRIVRTWAGNIGGSPYFNINTTYTNGSGTKVQNVVNFVAGTNEYVDMYSQGSALNDTTVQTVVQNAIPHLNGGVADVNGVYFVLTSDDVNETTGFCTQYCGWHWYGTIAGKNIKYSFVGNPARCPSSCSANSTVSPNGDVGGDGMVSITSHELEETVTDPNGNAWYDRRGNENGDKCAWTFGTTSTASNGSKYNITLGGLNMLIQQNWVNASGGFCAMSH